MKVDAGVDSDPRRVGNAARNLEWLGYDGVRVAETNRDPFIPLTLAADRTQRIDLVTSVVVAFARNPLSLAMQAHELNVFSRGRLVLGIGSQVKPHIERRFSMPWHGAAKQMREYIEALRAIFACWYEGKRLEYEGEFYRHTLMPRTFSPPNTSYGAPTIFLSATGPLMTNVAASLADGLITHPFSTHKYLREVTIPAVNQGLQKAGRCLNEFHIDYAPMLAVGDTDEQLESAISQLRHRIAFYACTVAYRPVLEIHGWGGLQDELIPLNRQHRADEMASLITDDMVQTIGIVGRPESVVDQMRSRFQSVVSRTGFHVPGIDAERLKGLLAQLKYGDGKSG